jgi:hypothetical protein
LLSIIKFPLLNVTNLSLLLPEPEVTSIQNETVNGIFTVPTEPDESVAPLVVIDKHPLNLQFGDVINEAEDPTAKDAPFPLRSWAVVPLPSSRGQ